jgi:hypothetical protein
MAGVLGLSRLDHETIEELVLRALKIGDGRQQVRLAASHRVGVTLGLLVLLPGPWRLVEEGADAGVVGIGSQGRHLLVQHGDLTSSALQPVVHVAQAPLDR